MVAASHRPSGFGCRATKNPTLHPTDSTRRVATRPTASHGGRRRPVEDILPRRDMARDRHEPTADQKAEARIPPSARPAPQVRAPLLSQWQASPDEDGGSRCRAYGLRRDGGSVRQFLHPRRNGLRSIGCGAGWNSGRRTPVERRSCRCPIGRRGGQDQSRAERWRKTDHLRCGTGREVLGAGTGRLVHGYRAVPDVHDQRQRRDMHGPARRCYDHFCRPAHDGHRGVPGEVGRRIRLPAKGSPGEPVGVGSLRAAD